MPAPVISIAQMREWEAATWASGKTEQEVIHVVGDRVAERVRRLTRPGDRVLVLAGRGHNGDDARRAAEALEGRSVALLNVADANESLPSLEHELSQKPAWIVDGLFGIGVNRPMDASWSAFIQKVNAGGAPILSIDSPSGINGDSGEIYGAAIRADITLTLGAAKAGLVSSDAAPFVGRLEVVPDIGLVDARPESDLQWSLPSDFEGFPPPRPAGGHKGTFGHLTIMAGSLGYHGAAVLTATAALRAQPGLVSVITSPETYVPVASQLRCPMVHPWDPAQELFSSATAVLCGPGLAAASVPREWKDRAMALWNESSLPVIADASALDWLGQESTPPQNALRVVTPHPGEAGRMLGGSSADVQRDRPSALRELSRRHGDCFVILKGRQTLVGSSSGRLWFNSSGNSKLGQGGSGDVLAGLISGFLAQPQLQEMALQTLRFAVWLHGATADRLSARRPRWSVDDLLSALGRSLARPSRPTRKGPARRREP